MGSCSKAPGALGEGRPDACVWNPEAKEHPLTMLREGQGFLKVQVAEEWCQSGVAIATGSSSDRTALGEKVLYKGLSPITHWAGLHPHFSWASPWYRSEGPPPCLGEKAPAMARRAPQQNRHWGHLGRGLGWGFGRAPGYACPPNDPGPRNRTFPLSLTFLPKPRSCWYRSQPSAQHTCPESSCFHYL